MVETPRDPIFLLDSHEHYQPIAVESVEAVPARIVLPDPDESDGGDAKLDSLPAVGGRMNFPRDPLDQEKRLRPDYGGVGYRRELDGGGLTWIQYWLWYLYNPKVFVELTGIHEGDWEFVQVGYEDGEPACMTVSQHHSGGKRDWGEVELRGGRPLVYVARDSHANFFLAVDEIDEIADDADGRGVALATLEWRDFGPWADWKGRWGNSTGEGRSPESPGCQGDRWKAPDRYHAGAEAQ